MTTIENWRTVSEIFFNFIQALAAIITAVVAVRSSGQIAGKIIEARGNGPVAAASPPSGMASSIP